MSLGSILFTSKQQCLLRSCFSLGSSDRTGRYLAHLPQTVSVPSVRQPSDLSSSELVAQLVANRRVLFLFRRFFFLLIATPSGGDNVPSCGGFSFLLSFVNPKYVIANFCQLFKFLESLRPQKTD